MILDELSKKYFKLTIKNKKKETPSNISADCILCGDKRGRLNLGAVKDPIGVCRCFNAGCPLNDNALPLPAYLKLVDSNLYMQYRKEKFNRDIGREEDLNHLLESSEPKVEKKKEPEENIDFKKVFPTLTKLTNSNEAIAYVRKRGISEDIYENWYFSRQKFIEVFNKKYYVYNFIFIPIYQNNKLAGFYTRSIYEKRFSTILFPNKEKYWSSDKILNNNRYYIFEGIFDALSSGLDHTIAMLSADLSDEILEQIEDPIFILDNDKTGRMKSIKYLNQGYKVFIWPNGIYEKDINELLNRMSIKEIKQMILNNIDSGFNAVMKVKMKR